MQKTKKTEKQRKQPRVEIRVGDEVEIKESETFLGGKLSFIVKEIESLNGIPFVKGTYGGFPAGALNKKER